MQQIRKNLLSNIMSLGVNILVGLLYTPFLIRNLGAAAYGVIPLALIINQYIAILTESLTRSITRFYSVEYRAGNYDKASRYLSTAICIVIILSVVIVPLCYPIIANIDELLHVPIELFDSAKKLFTLAIISFLIAVLTNCLNITIYSDNKLNLVNCVKISRNLTKLSVNILLFSFIGTDIVNVGIAFVASELIAFSISVLFYKLSKSQHICFDFSLFDFSVLKPVAGMILWISVICLANVFIYKIDTLFVNHYYGLYSTGVLGAISEFGSYCTSITAIAGSLFSPLILILYSKKEYSQAINLILRGGYVIFIISSVFCALVMGFSKQILSIWIGEVYEQYALWMMIKLSTLPIVTIGGIYSAINYWNRVKEPALLSVGLSVVVFALSVVVLESGISIKGYLIIESVFIFLQAYWINTRMILKIQSTVKSIVLKDLFKGVSFLMLITFSSYIIASLSNINNIFNLFGYLVFSTFVSIIISIPFLWGYLDEVNIIFPIKKCLTFCQQFTNNEK